MKNCTTQYWVKNPVFNWGKDLNRRFKENIKKDEGRYERHMKDAQRHQENAD